MEEEDILKDVAVPGDMARDDFEALVQQDVEDGQIDEEDELEEEEEEQDEVDQGVKEDKVDAQECLEALAKVRSYCQQQNFDIEIHHGLNKIQNKCLMEVMERKKQKRITDFFKH